MGEFEEQDWMELADADLSKVRMLIKVGKSDEFQDESEILACPIVKPQPPSPAQTQPTSDTPFELGNLSFPRPKPPSSCEPYTDPSRLSDEQIVEQLFSGLSIENMNTRPIHFPLFQRKDFVTYAKTIHERLAEETANEENIEEFAEELILHLYQSLTAQELNEVGDKLKVLRLEKKRDEKERFSKKKAKRVQVHREQTKPQEEFM